MTWTVRLRPEAEQDLSAAASWYEQQSSGLGDEFLDAAISVFGRIAQQPLIYPLVYRETRRALMRRFPFSVYFQPEAANIVVVAVLHASRHPGRWQSRAGLPSAKTGNL